MFFRNYTHLQLCRFAFENKIPMIVFRVYTHTHTRTHAHTLTHQSGLTHSMLFYILVLHTKRELKQKNRRAEAEGVSVTPLWRGSRLPPLPVLITKKRSEVTGEQASGNPVFKPLGRKWRGKGIGLAKKIIE